LRVTFRESSDDEIDIYFENKTNLKKKPEILTKNANRSIQKEINTSIQCDSEDDYGLFKQNKNLKLKNKITIRSESENEEDEETNFKKNKESRIKIQNEEVKEIKQKKQIKNVRILDSSDAEDEEDYEGKKSISKIAKTSIQKQQHQIRNKSKRDNPSNDESNEEQSVKENIKKKTKNMKDDSPHKKSDKKHFNTNILNDKKTDKVAKKNKKSKNTKSYRYEEDSSTDLSDECFDDIIEEEEAEQLERRNTESATYKKKETNVQFATPVAPVSEFLSKVKSRNESQSSEKTPIIIKINRTQNRSIMNDTRNLSIQLCQSIMSNSRINQSSLSNRSNLTANSSALNSSKKQIVIKTNCFTSNISKTNASDLSSTSSSTVIVSSTSNTKRTDFMKEMLMKAARNK
jgi:hypothetical protein